MQHALNIVQGIFVLVLATLTCAEQIHEGQERPSLEEVEKYLQSIGYSSLIASSDGKSILRTLEEDEESSYEQDQWFYIQNGIMALVCVIVAALAAGLTMGLVSQELLDLRIKEVAGTAKEKKQARAVIPLIQDHHRLLVTLLLLNAASNEALPLFLDQIVPGYVAIILSVTLVLFFGEIIPSAIFSGPNKLAIASKLAPLVRIIMWVLCPLAWPLGKMLDICLHEERDSGFMQKYDRGEISALVRLQYEERIAIKMKEKLARKNAGVESTLQDNSIRHGSNSVRYVKHIDTVNMVEGALEMQSKQVIDIMVPMRDMYCIPMDLVLDEENILGIYRSGYSRVPVHDPCSKDHIYGIFQTRQIMVMNPKESRDLSTLPLVQPFCVQPQMNVLSLVNLLQEGTVANKGGHLALVCLDPNVADLALAKGNQIPENAGVIGLVTLENCIEALIKEDIYDECDRGEKLARARAKWAADRWKVFVQKKKEQRTTVSVVVDDALAARQNETNELTSLLSPSFDERVYDPSHYQFQEYLV